MASFDDLSNIRHHDGSAEELRAMQAEQLDRLEEIAKLNTEVSSMNKMYIDLLAKVSKKLKLLGDLSEELEGGLRLYPDSLDVESKRRFHLIIQNSILSRKMCETASSGHEALADQCVIGTGFSPLSSQISTDVLSTMVGMDTTDSDETMAAHMDDQNLGSLDCSPECDGSESLASLDTPPSNSRSLDVFSQPIVPIHCEEREDSLLLCVSRTLETEMTNDEGIVNEKKSNDEGHVDDNDVHTNEEICNKSDNGDNIDESVRLIVSEEVHLDEECSASDVHLRNSIPEQHEPMIEEEWCEKRDEGMTANGTIPLDMTIVNGKKMELLKEKERSSRKRKMPSWMPKLDNLGKGKEIRKAQRSKEAIRMEMSLNRSIMKRKKKEKGDTRVEKVKDDKKKVDESIGINEEMEMVKEEGENKEVMERTKKEDEEEMKFVDKQRVDEMKWMNEVRGPSLEPPCYSIPVTPTGRLPFKDNLISERLSAPAVTLQQRVPTEKNCVEVVTLGSSPEEKRKKIIIIDSSPEETILGKRREEDADEINTGVSPSLLSCVVINSWTNEKEKDGTLSLVPSQSKESLSQLDCMDEPKLVIAEDEWMKSKSECDDIDSTITRYEPLPVPPPPQVILSPAASLLLSSSQSFHRPSLEEVIESIPRPNDIHPSLSTSQIEVKDVKVGQSMHPTVEMGKNTLLASLQEEVNRRVEMKERRSRKDSDCRHLSRGRSRSNERRDCSYRSWGGNWRRRRSGSRTSSSDGRYCRSRSSSCQHGTPPWSKSKSPSTSPDAHALPRSFARHRNRSLSPKESEDGKRIESRGETLTTIQSPLRPMTVDGCMDSDNGEDSSGSILPTLSPLSGVFHYPPLSRTPHKSTPSSSTTSIVTGEGNTSTTLNAQSLVTAPKMKINLNLARLKLKNEEKKDEHEKRMIDNVDAIKVETIVSTKEKENESESVEKKREENDASIKEEPLSPNHYNKDTRRCSFYGPMPQPVSSCKTVPNRIDDNCGQIAPVSYSQMSRDRELRSVLIPPPPPPISSQPCSSRDGHHTGRIPPFIHPNRVPMASSPRDWYPNMMKPNFILPPQGVFPPMGPHTMNGQGMDGQSMMCPPMGLMDWKGDIPPSYPSRPSPPSLMTAMGVMRGVDNVPPAVDWGQAARMFSNQGHVLSPHHFSRAIPRGGRFAGNWRHY